MQSDLITRVLLAAIVLCQLLLIGQHAMDSGSSASAQAPEPRYHVQVSGMRKGGPLLVRTDRVTGTVWRKSLSGDGPWVVVDEETREAGASAE